MGSNSDGRGDYIPPSAGFEDFGGDVIKMSVPRPTEAPTRKSEIDNNYEGADDIFGDDFWN